MTGFAARVHSFNLIHHIHTLGHFGKHAVTPALWVLSAVVQETIVLHIDKKLWSSTVSIVGPGHGYAAYCIGQAVVRFVFNRFAGFFGFHVGREPAALNHEVADDPMKDGAVVKAFLRVLFEIRSGFWGFFEIQFQGDVPQGGMQSNHCGSLSMHKNRSANHTPLGLRAKPGVKRMKTEARGRSHYLL